MKLKDLGLLLWSWWGKMGNVEEMCGKKKNLEIETERRGINLTLFGDRRKKVFCELLVLIVLFVRTNFEM